MGMINEWLQLEEQIKDLIYPSQNPVEQTPEQLQDDLHQLKRCADATDLLIKKLQNFRMQLSAVSLKKKTALDEYFLKENSVSPASIKHLFPK